MCAGVGGCSPGCHHPQCAATFALSREQNVSPIKEKESETNKAATSKSAVRSVPPRGFTVNMKLL